MQGWVEPGGSNLLGNLYLPSCLVRKFEGVSRKFVCPNFVYSTQKDQGLEKCFKDVFYLEKQYLRLVLLYSAGEPSQIQSRITYVVVA